MIQLILEKDAVFSLASDANPKVLGQTDQLFHKVVTLAQAIVSQSKMNLERRNNNTISETATTNKDETF